MADDIGPASVPSGNPSRPFLLEFTDAYSYVTTLAALRARLGLAEEPDGTLVRRAHGDVGAGHAVRKQVRPSRGGGVGVRRRSEASRTEEAGEPDALSFSRVGLHTLQPR